MNTLNPREQEILNRLTAFMEEKGYSPSLREMARLAGLKSADTVRYYYKRLVEKGLLQQDKDSHRTVRISSHSPAFKIPILGTVPAGPLSTAVEEHEDCIEVDPSLVKGKSLALRVKGDSMKDAAIVNGDIVVVRLQQSALDGDIVVARFEDEVTVKYFRKLKNGFFLVPANEAYKPFPLDSAEIVGKVTGVIRGY